ncbi:MAG: DUF4296 domain-containing protein [Bacteroidota bacterium]
MFNYSELYLAISRLAICLLVGLVVPACGGDDNSASPIPVEELTEIITETLLLEPAGKELPQIMQDSVAAIYYGKILAQRGYTTDEFISAMAYLQQDSEQLAAVYNQVMENLTVMESEQK